MEGGAFLRQAKGDRQDILRAGEALLGRPAHILEKDVWLCWCLARLFSIPDRPEMAFKGGTSLSKVFNVIDRFSEDVDVTLDYRSLMPGSEPFDPMASKTKQKKLGETLRETVRSYSHEQVVPYLRRSLLEACEGGTIEVSDNGEMIRIHYPSAFDDRRAYVQESVLLELGGRNITDPKESRLVRPYLAECFDQVSFDVAEVEVLSAARTFWEKVTLIHAECNRNQFRQGAERLARHWYDLVQLADHEIGREAVLNHDLLADVVRHKSVFFYSSFARYDACLNGAVRLLPEADLLRSLQRDYEAMIEAGMFSSEPPSFTEIVSRLELLERTINQAVSV